MKEMMILRTSRQNQKTVCEILFSTNKRKMMSPQCQGRNDDFDLGFKPVELVFKDLKYTVKDKDGKDLVLIQNINGYATPEDSLL